MAIPVDTPSVASKLPSKFITGSKVLLVNLIILAVVLLCCELVVRWWRPQQTYSLLLAHLGEHYVSGDFIPFTLKSNYTAHPISQEFRDRTVTYTTNRLGLRGKDVTLRKPEGTFRILVLGDSYTFGVYVDDNETYPAVLEEYLQQQAKPIEVINAGYADGWSPDAHYAWLINRGLAFEPDLIIYGFFEGDDVERIRSKGWIELNEKGLPIRIVDDSIYVDDLGRIRSKSKVEDSKTVGSAFIYNIPVLRESHFLVYFNWKIRAFGKKLSQAYATNPQPQWFPIILRRKSDNQSTKENERLFLELVKGMRDAARENNAEFILLMIPANFQVDSDFLTKLKLGPGRQEVRRNYFDEIKSVLNESEIAYIDLLSAMKMNPGSYFPRNGEVHFNPNGHRFTARTIERFLENSPRYHRLFERKADYGEAGEKE